MHGERKQGLQHFKPLCKTILQFSDHKEFKFDGDIGLLRRKHIHADGLIHIGKEANNIDNQPLQVDGAQIFSNMKSICDRILSIRQRDAEKAEVDRRIFQRIKERIRKTGKINLKTRAVKRLLT